MLIAKRVPRGLNAGQWALPGGKLDPGEDAVDRGAARAARGGRARHRPPAAVAGLLDDLVTDSGFCITPVVVIAPPGARPVRNPAEIASLHPVPLANLDAEHVPRWARTPDGRPLLQMPLRHDMVIHAPTGAILLQFREVALRGRELRIAISRSRSGRAALAVRLAATSSSSKRRPAVVGAHDRRRRRSAA